MRKIVFVCLGNICRSPMAEFLMKDLVRQNDQAADFEIASRATSSWEHGNPIHQGSQRMMLAHGIPFDADKTSQKISAADFAYFDEIIAMDQANVDDLQEMAPAGTSHKIRKLMSQDVPDPWYSGNFAGTYDLLQVGLADLL
ncbi:phosphatase [Weissella oryzae SG25]|uniref:protein-tyrosine-phosphatase n=1 Tax=Weissella oryzae (strain DSM 25784 / JCM 18191 / LMG 30913 / SG25) TaxID=1329250 RepID=A0A069CRR7_WEIOS|nr:low molecular weight protein-tyrosine-phosphatase [Weissella oryzae]GAK30475.1 phosphatase [Weissella oryzae SG25]